MILYRVAAGHQAIVKNPHGLQHKEQLSRILFSYHCLKAERGSGEKENQTQIQMKVPAPGLGLASV